MPLYKMTVKNQNFSEAEIESAELRDIEKECFIEDWIEAHPFCLNLGELLIIHRQPTVKNNTTKLRPDLIAVDEEGNLYVIELKKGRCEREILAQAFEYSAWLSSLSDDEIIELINPYLESRKKGRFTEAFLASYTKAQIPKFNRPIKVVLVAEEITQRVKDVVDYFKNYTSLQIMTCEVNLYATSNEHYFLKTTSSDFQKPKELKISNKSTGWNEDLSVREIVHEAVLSFTKGDASVSFTHPDIMSLVLKKYPNAKPNTIRCHLYADCVGHPSRHHYSGRKDMYQFVEHGVFKLLSSKSKKVA